jgi:quercetin dioxygenase-like cupin family protein
MAVEVAAAVLAPGAGETLLNPVGGHVIFKARGHETGGRLTAFETVITPGDGPPLHVHATDDEVAYVLEGVIDFLLGEDLHRCRPGSFVFIPPGTPHTFQNVGTDDARMLMIFTPSGIERLFEGAAESGATSAESEAWAGAAREARTEMVGPPLRRSRIES